MEHRYRIQGSVCAVVWLPALLVTLGACTWTERTEVRVPVGDERTRLVRDRAVDSSIGGEARVDGNALVGQVRWKDACVTETVRDMRTDHVAVEQSDLGGNIALLTLGTISIGGAAYAADQSTMASDVDECSVDESGKETCASDKDTLTGAAVLMGLAGAGMLVGGLYGLEKTPKETVLSSGMGEESTRAGARLPCGSAHALEGLEIVLTAPRLPRLHATADREGRFRVDLPLLDDYPSDAVGTISIGDIPDRLKDFVGRTSYAAQISLAPYAAALAERRRLLEEEQRAARSVADRHHFAGAIHGDLVAKQGFTFACEADGEDICFDAIDNDCDGLYDIGCGYRSGALQWTLAWRTRDDLDLHVIGPDGAHVFYGNRKGQAARLELDVDCLGMFGTNCLEQNVENIFSPPERPPLEGTYRGWVQVYQSAPAEGGDSSRVVIAMLGGRLGGRTFRLPMTLPAQSGSRVFFAFAIGPDEDGDSVIDSQDACPGAPGVYSDARGECGCPDADGDGIADAADECPQVPGIREASPRNRAGCPRTYGKVRVTDFEVQITDTIKFQTGHAQILPQYYGLLGDVGAAMRDMPHKLSVVMIGGHTDDRGSPETNMHLSAARARSVYEHLVKREKIPSSRLRVRWAGPHEPVQPNDGERARAYNRRVSLDILEPQPTGQRSW